MAANAVVRARIDEHIKEEATAVLAAMGLTVSDAFGILLARVAREKALPFEPLVPNSVTIEAMKEARRGGLKSFATVRGSDGGSECGRLSRRVSSGATSSGKPRALIGRPCRTILWLLSQPWRTTGRWPRNIVTTR